MERYLIISARCLLATVFAVAFFGKGRDASRFQGFVTSIQKLTMFSPRAAKLVALTIVTCEGITATLLALPVAVKAGFVLASALLAVFIAVVVRAVRGGALAQCRCFGEAGSVMSSAMIVRNLLLMAFAVPGIFITPATPATPAADPVFTTIALATGFALAVFFTRSYDHIVRAVVMRLKEHETKTVVTSSRQGAER